MNITFAHEAVVVFSTSLDSVMTHLVSTFFLFIRRVLYIYIYIILALTQDSRLESIHLLSLFHSLDTQRVQQFAVSTKIAIPHTN